MTREVDNFFPLHFKYVKISVPDDASTNLLNNWNLTYSFIKEAKYVDLFPLRFRSRRNAKSCSIFSENRVRCA